MEGSSSRKIIDLGPGENHIAIRYPSKSYYVPEIFHMSPTDGKIIPLFISDINRSRTILEVYGSKGFDKYMNNFILINNYPIQKIKITGKIIGETSKDFSEGNEGNLKNYVLVTLDDFSSDNKLTIFVRVKEPMYLSSGLVFNQSYGRIIEVVGIVNELGNRREVLTDYLSVIGNNEELDVEIQCWKETLEFRNKVLATPWIYEPPKLNRIPTTYSEPKLLRKDYNRKKFKENLDIIDTEDEVSPSRPFREDSILLMQKPKASHDNFIDLTDAIEDSDHPEVEEIDPYHLVSDSEIQILEVNEIHSSNYANPSPIQVLEEFQLTLEFVLWILNHGHCRFKLIDVYKNLKIRYLLDNLADLKLLSRRHNSNGEEARIKRQDKHEIFHTVRHLLHINYRLINVSPNQEVYLDNLFQLTDHLKYCLSVIKLHKMNEDKTTILNIESYLSIFKNHSNNLVGDVNYKLINGIIDWILTNEFNDRNKWKYDSKVVEWSYIG